MRTHSWGSAEAWQIPGLRAWESAEIAGLPQLQAQLYGLLFSICNLHSSPASQYRSSGRDGDPPEMLRQTFFQVSQISAKWRAAQICMSSLSTLDRDSTVKKEVLSFSVMQVCGRAQITPTFL